MAHTELAEAPSDVQSALGAIEGALGDLESAISSGLLETSTATQVMGVLGLLARDLAQRRIEHAIVREGDSGEIAEALALHDQGDALRSAGSVKEAAAKYKDSAAKADGA